MEKDFTIQHNTIWHVHMYLILTTTYPHQAHEDSGQAGHVCNTNSKYNFISLFNFLAVIEHVRDGCTVRAFLLPDFYHVTIMITGIKVC